ncbi:MAG: hypothetical protein U1F77_05860 [Kiritimatiellia bacterium]
MKREWQEAAILVGVCAGWFHAVGAERINDLLAPRKTLAVEIAAAPKNWTARMEGGSILLEGPAGDASVTVVVKPAGGKPWNLDDWNYARMDVRNDGPGLVRMDARLENAQAEDWRNCFPCSAVALPGEQVVLGYPFTRPDDRYDGPGIFTSMAARPDGFRIHWRSFDPAAVRQIRVTVRASRGPVRLRIGSLQAAWPRNAETRTRLEELPLLDEFGQLRAVDWPGKSHSVEGLRDALQHEAGVLEARPDDGLDRFGGWKAGPLLRATGNFRTEKVDGRWWLVDPEGRLFWSMGVNCVGYNAGTPLTGREPLFAWVPPAESAMRAEVIESGRDRKSEVIQFPAANLHRALGPDWRKAADDLTHRRMRAWGVNTMAAWSDATLMRQQRTPYTLTTGVWWPVWRMHGQHLPEPFDPAFEKSLRESLKAFAWAKDDPFCLGVFIDNELDWPDTFGAAVLQAGEQQPARVWALERLREKHPGLAALSDSHEKELDDPYADYIATYFETCRRVLNEELPRSRKLPGLPHPAMITPAGPGGPDAGRCLLGQPL